MLVDRYTSQGHVKKKKVYDDVKEKFGEKAVKEVFGKDSVLDPKNIGLEIVDEELVDQGQREDSGGIDPRLLDGYGKKKFDMSYDKNGYKYDTRGTEV